jgi:hypothetical protein
MKKHVLFLFAAAGIYAFGLNVYAAGTAEQVVTFTIGASNEITVSGPPGLMEILAAAAGSDPESVTDNNTTISYSTNSNNKKITGGIDLEMPSGVTLEVHIAAPGGAQGISQGTKSLSVTATDLVTGISKAAVQEAAITYTLSATTEADPIENAIRTVTYTLIAD